MSDSRQGAYRIDLDGIAARAEWMAADVPADLADLARTLEQENVRRLSVAVLIDLLAMEQDAARAWTLACDAAALGEDLLLAGDYAGALDIVRALARHGRDVGPTSEAARIALDGLANTIAFHEATQYLGEMDERTAALFVDICTAIGPACVDVAPHRRLPATRRFPPAASRGLR